MRCGHASSSDTIHVFVSAYKPKEIALAIPPFARTEL